MQQSSSKKLWCFHHAGLYERGVFCDDHFRWASIKLGCCNYCRLERQSHLATTQNCSFHHEAQGFYLFLLPLRWRLQLPLLASWMHPLATCIHLIYILVSCSEPESKNNPLACDRCLWLWLCPNSEAVLECCSSATLCCMRQSRVGGMGLMWR